MLETKRESEEEFADLKEEIKNFKKEKEKLRAIVGQIGGVPRLNTRFFNSIFVIFVLACLGLSLICKATLRLALGELAIAAISIKLIYLIHNQTRVNHFQLWILSSIEWRLNEIIKAINEKNIQK